MGILESNPIILGKKIKLSTQEQEYFQTVNGILRKRYHQNLYSDDNLKTSLEQKTFESNQFSQVQLEDISWIDYINRHLAVVLSRNENAFWARELDNALSNKVFVSENKYLSDFFYNEYYFETCPLKLDEKNENINNSISIDLSNHSLKTIKTLNDLSQNNAYDELDITDNLGGSYLEMNLDLSDPNDANYQYNMKRKHLKKYIKVFKEHIYDNPEHPICLVIILFVKYFCRYIKTKMDNFDNELKNQLLVGNNYEKNIKDFEKEITNNLREFIMVMHTSLKLFYSTCVDYSYFEEEKDDLFNLITSLIFRTGDLYENIFNLYSKSFSQEFEVLEGKLNDLQNLKPKDLNVQIKYCLDEDTLELQKNILKEKKNEKNQKENKEQNIQEKNKQKENDLFQIKEDEEIEDDNDKNNSKDNIITTTKNMDIINTNDNNKININKEYNKNIINITSKKDDEDDVYLLEKINDESIDTKDALSMHLRNTVNCFNNKKYLFPKIRKNLRDTLAVNEQYIREVKNSGKLPIPYYSAINLFKHIRNYKTPFEKIIILAAINDQITESVTSFWNSMTKYVKNSFLMIEADEMMAIFAFIVIKSQMPEMLIESKIITNFTTPSTRAFNISYNLTLLDASIETINQMDSIKVKTDRNKELKDVRKSIAVFATQRLSRLSGKGV